MARAVVAMTGDARPLVQLTPEEEASFDESLAQADRREFSTGEAIHSIWTKDGL